MKERNTIDVPRARTVKLGVSILLAAGGVACGSAFTVKQVPAHEYLARNLAPTASFDLHCPADQLQFENAGPPRPDDDDYFGDGNHLASVHGLSDQQGVTGCGKRVRYVFVDGKWVMNVASEEESQGTALSK